MKKVLTPTLILLGCAMGLQANEEAKAQPGEIEKKGFLMTEGCYKQSTFRECDLGGYYAGTDKPILFVHDDFRYYMLDLSAVSKSEIDEGMARNNVIIIGKLSGDTIKVRAYKAPPPEGKSFFKGCL